MMTDDSEQQKIAALTATRSRNNRVRWAVFDYLADNPYETVAEQIAQFGLPSQAGEKLFRSFFVSYCRELLEADGPADPLATDQVASALHRLDPQTYYSDPFYHDIEIPEVQEGNWQLCREMHHPYEAFVCNDIVLEADFREIPQLGFFTEPFSFPSVMENGHEWMSVKPNEVETMRAAVAAAHGSVAVFGLGIGYFAYLISLKGSVDRIVVVERDQTVIDLFKKYILPQFSRKDKIEIVTEDAFAFAARMKEQGPFDFAFVDLWHDVSDGLDLYMKMKKMERHSPGTQFSYWIEESLLSALRWRLFNAVVAHAPSYREIVRELGDDNLRRFSSIDL